LVSSESSVEAGETSLGADGLLQSFFVRFLSVRTATPGAFERHPAKKKNIAEAVPVGEIGRIEMNERE
jgi:hypothetical protein